MTLEDDLACRGENKQWQGDGRGQKAGNGRRRGKKNNNNNNNNNSDVDMLCLHLMNMRTPRASLKRDTIPNETAQLSRAIGT